MDPFVVFHSNLMIRLPAHIAFCCETKFPTRSNTLHIANFFIRCSNKLVLGNSSERPAFSTSSTLKYFLITFSP